MTNHTISETLLRDIYEVTQDAEYDATSGLCHQCGEAVSPLHNHSHTPTCKWANTITQIETLLANEPRSLKLSSPPRRIFITDIFTIRNYVTDSVKEAVNYGEFDLDTKFDFLELDSLDAVEIVMRLETDFKITYTDAESERLQKTTNSRELAAEVLLIHSERNR